MSASKCLYTGSQCGNPALPGKVFCQLHCCVGCNGEKTSKDRTCPNCVGKVSVSSPANMSPTNMSPASTSAARMSPANMSPVNLSPAGSPRAGKCGYTRGNCLHPPLPGGSCCQLHTCPRCGREKSSREPACALCGTGGSFTAGAGAVSSPGLVPACGSGVGFVQGVSSPGLMPACGSGVGFIQAQPCFPQQPQLTGSPRFTAPPCQQYRNDQAEVEEEDEDSDSSSEDNQPAARDGGGDNGGGGSAGEESAMKDVKEAVEVAEKVLDIVQKVGEMFS